jgi:putative phosphoribosyl transferase
MFRNRKDAGEQLALALQKYEGQSILVLGIPKGGVEVGYYIARHLNAALAIVVSRKLGFPTEPEAAFGAIAEDGSVYISTAAYKHLSSEEIHEVLDAEKKEIESRIRIFRKNKPLPSLQGRTIIIADDGIATGATIFVTIDLCKRANAAKIIVAAPVASGRMEKILSQKADEVVILEKSEFLSSVSEAYDDFPDLSVAETLDFIKDFESEDHTIQR